MLAACIQLTSRNDVDANLATCARLLRQARQRGAELAVLPENFAFMGMKEHDKFAVAESLNDAPGKIQSALLALARETGLWIIGGGLPERVEQEAGFVHNTLIACSPAGDLAARYRKVHLFDVDIPGGAQFKESGSVAPGTDAVTLETPWGKIGLTICYDLRFPELYRRLTRAGARILVVPAAFTLHTGKDHWKPLLQARAIENQCFVLAPGQYGKAFEGRVSWGHSMIIDPWGTVLAEAPDRECAILAELDFEHQDKIRRELPVLAHQRF
jgi:nitrilase